MGGNWGPIPTGRTPGSQRRRVALSIGSVVAAIVLVLALANLGAASDPSITGTVLLILVLLIAGVVVGLRPWSRS
jgi:hypothetical protein